MNKDVIYIEPEQDITDILSNIKASKHKIVALVPPKKAGVLRSAVNFKLIAKAARQSEKTVVLITADEALRRLAGSVSMPVAKSLQSKPQLPETDDAEEFGDEKNTEDKKDDEVAEEESEEDDAKEAEAAKTSKKDAGEKVAVKKVPAAVVAKKEAKKSTEDDVIEGEPETQTDDEKEPKTKAEKNVAKMKGAKVPNFAKYRNKIIAAAVVLILVIGFAVWASVFAPAAKISVKVHTSSENFTEKVSFVNDESKSKPEEGIFFLEQQTVTKKAEGEFKATGEVDKGTKATGKITVVRPKGEEITEANQNFSIPKGTIFTISGKQYITTEGGSVNVTNIAGQTSNACGFFRPCYKLKEALSSGGISVVAKDNGDTFNMDATTSGITANINIPENYSITSTAITGGSSKMVKVVSQEDLENASNSLDMPSQDEISTELANEFGAEYIFLGSLKQSEPKVVTSPSLNEEVGNNITPKIVKEVTYTMYAVKREPVKAFISKIVTARLGDNTQEVYDDGIGKAFFEAFKNSDNDNSAKLKTTVKTGPRVTDEMVREKSLGKKVGEVQSLLKSIKGISSVKVDTSYFFVTSIPDDTNKVEINIEIEE